MALANKRTTFRPVRTPLTAATALVGADLDFEPQTVRGCVLWLRADAIMGVAHGDAVAAWPDRSRNGNNATQATSDKRPTLQRGVINGRAVVRFDGINDSLETSLTQAQPFTAVFVGKQTSKATWGRFFDSAGRALFSLDMTTGLPAMYAGIFANGTGDYSGAFHAFTLFYNRASSRGFIDGVLNIAGDISTNELRLARLGNDPPQNTPLTGDIAEFLIYNRVLTAAERKRLERRAHRLYNVPIAP